MLFLVYGIVMILIIAIIIDIIMVAIVTVNVVITGIILMKTRWFFKFCCFSLMLLLIV